MSLTDEPIDVDAADRVSIMTVDTDDDESVVFVSNDEDEEVVSDDSEPVPDAKRSDISIKYKLQCIEKAVKVMEATEDVKDRLLVEELKWRQQLSKKLKLKNTIKQQQVRQWMQQKDRLVADGIARGVAKSSRIRRSANALDHSGKYGAVWEEVWNHVQQWLKKGEHISRRRIKRTAKQVALSIDSVKNHAQQVVRRKNVCAFLRRHRIRISKAARVTKDSDEVRLNKAKCFHWFCALLSRMVPGITEDDIWNCDEMPLTPCGAMSRIDTVCSVGDEVTECANYSILSENKRIGTFMPVIGTKKLDVFGLVLFRGGAQNPVH